LWKVHSGKYVLEGLDDLILKISFLRNIVPKISACSIKFMEHIIWKFFMKGKIVVLKV